MPEENITEQPQAPIANNPVPASPKTNGSNKVLMWALVIIFVVVILGATGYFLLNSKSTDLSSNATPTPTSTQTLTNSPTASPSASPTPNFGVIDSDVSLWKTFTIKTLGLEFKLPTQISSQLGNSSEDFATTTSGKALRFNFTQGLNVLGDPAFVGANTTDSSAARSPIFTDLVGYSVAGGKYSTKYHSSDGFRTVSIPQENIISETTTTNGFKTLLIKRVGSFETQVPSSFIFMSTNTGALINNPTNSTYPGVVVQANLSGTFTQEVFTKILSTIKVSH